MGDALAVRKELRAMDLRVLHAGVAIGLLIGARGRGRECEPNKTENNQSADLSNQGKPPYGLSDKQPMLAVSRGRGRFAAACGGRGLTSGVVALGLVGGLGGAPLSGGAVERHALDAADRRLF